MRPGVREESASPAWLAAPAMNARDTTKVYIWRLDTRCGPTLYRKYHNHNKPGKRHNNTWVLPAPHSKGNKCDRNVNTKELIHCHCGINNRAPRWTKTLKKAPTIIQNSFIHKNGNCRYNFFCFRSRRTLFCQGTSWFEKEVHLGWHH